MVSRPFEPTLHGTKPKSFLQFKYIELGARETGDKYISMLRNDHSSYSLMYPAVATSTETVGHALLDWCAAFGAPTQFISDGPTSFQYEKFRLLSKGFDTHHHFTMPYCPWSNGGVERLEKELLRVTRSSF